MIDSRPVIFADVGNTSIAAGCFPRSPQADWWRVPTVHWRWGSLTAISWGDFPANALSWVVATVNSDISEQLRQLVADHRPQDSWTIVPSDQFPIETRVYDKSQVGADRLAAAVAANAIREPARGAVVVDAGSAVNVELIDEDGIFCGGAILPGMAMAAEALASRTALLPTVSPADRAPPVVGRDTNEAIRSGLYWGSWGAIQELAKQFQSACCQPPHLMLTGGGIIWGGLRSDFELHPHLVLSGIALAWSAIDSAATSQRPGHS